MRRREGDISDREMFTTFNMGIGLMIFVDPAERDRLMASLNRSGEESFVIGEVTAGMGDRVTIK
jgi:phosphoribosylformylglycinamidine cyclo-ligase